MEPFDKDAISVDVGGRLRDLREQRNLSMRALARMSGLSANALSMIERGKSSPSVSTLYKLAEALEVPITCFFRTETPQDDVVFRKSSARTRVPFHRGLWEGLGGESFMGHVEPFMLTLESGANSGRFPMAHTGHEFVMCLRGQLEYQVENQLFVLEPGDSLLFAAELRHQWRNPGNTVTNAIFVLAGFDEDEHPSEFHIASGLASETEDVSTEADEG
ncbi:MAG: helix-turn-helix transcriptional regulator [Chloroflexi bacterium]|nr:helix-turn-helix transcriptional regulator [Chloroflexota bacterium]